MFVHVKLMTIVFNDMIRKKEEEERLSINLGIPTIL